MGKVTGFLEIDRPSPMRRTKAVLRALFAGIALPTAAGPAAACMSGFSTFDFASPASDPPTDFHIGTNYFIGKVLEVRKLPAGGKGVNHEVVFEVLRPYDQIGATPDHQVTIRAYFGSGRGDCGGRVSLGDIGKFGLRDGKLMATHSDF